MKRVFAQLGAALYFAAALSLAVLPVVEAETFTIVRPFGTAATVNTGTSGATIPLLNGANTFSGAVAFTPAVGALPVITTHVASSGSGAGFQIGSTLTGTASGSSIVIVPNWNTSASPKVIRVNATNTASGAAARFLSLEVSAVDKFVVDLPTGVYRHAVTTVALLPTCNAGMEGSHYGVTDATAPAALATVAGGGAVHVPVYCDGTNWIVG